MDAPVALPSMGFRGGLLKAAVVVPDLIISGLIGFVLVAASPPDVAVGFLTVLLVVSLVIASGRAEGVAVPILHAAHRPTAFEAHHLAGPLRLVNRSGRDDLRILVGGGGEAVSAAGSHHVILHRGIVDALIGGRISEGEAAALIAHGVGRLRLGQPRLDLLVTLWTLPWDFIRGLFAGIGQQLSWVPLGRLAWQTRFVVGTIAVVLETQAGRWPSPIIIAGFLVLSYLMPCGRAGWHRHLITAADHHASQLGYAEPLAGFLRRLPRDAALADRLEHLGHPATRPDAVVRLGR